jgi:hypothetical protein
MGSATPNAITPGAKAEWLLLDANGIRGVGHMVMIEKNNRDLPR